MRAVPVAVFIARVGRVEGEAGAGAEIDVVHLDPGVDDVDRDVGAGRRVCVRPVQVEGALVDPGQIPWGVRLQTLVVDALVLLDEGADPFLAEASRQVLASSEW